jgi:hypothetical protein
MYYQLNLAASIVDVKWRLEECRGKYRLTAQNIDNDGKPTLIAACPPQDFDDPVDALIHFRCIDDVIFLVTSGVADPVRYKEIHAAVSVALKLDHPNSNSMRQKLKLDTNLQPLEQNYAQVVG